MMVLESNESEMEESVSPASAFEPVPGNGICTRLGDKWTIQVVWHLSRASGRRLPYSGLKLALNGITQRMLTLTLRNLERDGLVIRHRLPEVPPRVDYELTEVGAGMLPALEAVNAWVRGSLPHIDASRRAYDEARDSIVLR